MIINIADKFLVHEHQGALEAVVDGIITRISHAAALHLLTPHTKVVVPQFVGPGQLLKRSFEHLQCSNVVETNLHIAAGYQVEDVLGRVLLVVNVPDPRSDGVRVAKNLLLVGEVVLLQHQVGRLRGRYRRVDHSKLSL